MKNQLSKIEEYKNYNNKAIYYRVKRNKKVEIIDPSFVFELIFFEKYEMLENELKLCYIQKDKKINRMTKLNIQTLEDRFFRSLVNKDKYHTLELANELILRDDKKFFNIMYELSYIAEDENKLIKTYLFEIMYKKIGYNVYILRNLIQYFISSCNKYMNVDDEKQMKYFYENVSKLYVLIYNIKNENKLNIQSKKEMSNIKEIIYNSLKERVE